MKIYDLCKDCEHLYHCFGIEIAKEIENNMIKDIYLQPGICSNYYPEIKQ